MTGDPKEVPIIGPKLIKPAEKDPFPDSVSLHIKPKEDKKDDHKGTKTRR